MLKTHKKNATHQLERAIILSMEKQIICMRSAFNMGAILSFLKNLFSPRRWQRWRRQNQILYFCAYENL